MTRNLVATILLLLCLSFLLATSAGAMVYYVGAGATGANNGLSWADAFTTIQAGIDAAGALGGGEIWVRAGVYDKMQDAALSDSFEARNPNAVDIIGDEMDLPSTSGGIKRVPHICVIHLLGDVTGVTPSATFGSTTDKDSFSARLAALTPRSDVLVIANHPGFNQGTDRTISKEELSTAANTGSIHAMELQLTDDVAKWDYALANLDDQAGDCSKILWGIRSNDQHYLGGVDYTRNTIQVGTIPTPAEDPVYSNRRLAFKDMIRRGSFASMRAGVRCGMPTYALNSTAGVATGMQINLRLDHMAWATRAELRFYGCDWATGGVPGTLLYSVPLTLDSANVSDYYLTRTGAADGIPLSTLEKANIKYVRPVLVMTINTDTKISYFQPVRIRVDGAWWNGPRYTLAGRHATVNGSPYPIGGTDSGETIYFDPHTHSINSDGNASPSVMRNKYWANFGMIDPTKPRFSIVTDHNRRTPFMTPARSVAVLKEGVRLYGGFAGNETARSQRNPSVNQTMIDGRDLGRCLYVDGSTWTDKTNLVIDGFAIRRGKVINGDGAGLCAYDCSPTITNCTFSANNATYGAGMLGLGSAVVTGCTFSGNNATLSGGAILNSPGTTPVITDCSFSGNTARKGAAVGSFYCAPVLSQCNFSSNTCLSQGGMDGGGALYWNEAGGSITSCIFSGNSTTGINGVGGAMVMWYSTAVIANNTIVGNTAGSAGAIHCRDRARPTVANNIIAFNSSGIQQMDNSAPVLRSNCFYANTQYNYSAVSAGAGDISLDPLFADRTGENLRLRSDSPCIDTGSNPDASRYDMDGRSAPLDGNGDGIAVCDIGAFEFRRVFVDGDAPGPWDGNSWDTAYRSIQEGLDSAATGDEMWVAGGTYRERITLKNGVALYGGFGGTETSRDGRDWATHPTIVDGMRDGTTVSIPAGCNSETRLDGFTVRGGNAFQGGGIYCHSASPVITNNTITDNNALYGGGIYCYSSASAAISGNMVISNTASNGAGIFCSASPGLKITNNTICGNSASIDGGGILASSSPSTLSNNIVAFNSSGIRSYGTQTLQKNCVYGNTLYNYLGVSPGTTDISADPLFADRSGGNYHLVIGSPCTNAGTGAAAALPLLDIDGEGRVSDYIVDIGADEIWPAKMSLWGAKMGRDGVVVEIGGTTASAVFGDSFYVESPNRACGMRVDRVSHGIVPGTKVLISGTVGTDSNGERYIAATSVTPTGFGEVEPMALTLRYLGGGDWFYDPITRLGQRGVKDGAGLNNMGLLVRAVGEITAIGAGYIYVDDGSRPVDGTSSAGGPNIGARVLCDPAGYRVGDHVSVAGISSSFARGEYIYRMLRATEITMIH